MGLPIKCMFDGTTFTAYPFELLSTQTCYLSVVFSIGTSICKNVIRPVLLYHLSQYVYALTPYSFKTLLLPNLFVEPRSLPGHF